MPTPSSLTSPEIRPRSISCNPTWFWNSGALLPNPKRKKGRFAGKRERITYSRRLSGGYGGRFIITQEERLSYLVRALAGESSGIEMPQSYSGQRLLLRALMNVRPPIAMDSEWLQIQDAFLQMETELKGIVDVMELPSIPDEPRISVWQGDITRLKADAVVNAANPALLGCFYPNHGCIDNAIHSAAGFQLRLACRELMDAQGHEEPEGRAKCTPGFNLPAKYVIHTVGPVVRGSLTREHCRTLASCYHACMTVAAKAGCRSIAFCCVSTGEYHFPNGRAAEIAAASVRESLLCYPAMKRVVFNVFKEMDWRIYTRLLGEPRAAAGDV